MHWVFNAELSGGRQTHWRGCRQAAAASGGHWATSKRSGRSEGVTLHKAESVRAKSAAVAEARYILCILPLAVHILTS